MGGASWLAAEGTLIALGICARSISPFSVFYELRDATHRRDAQAISEKVDLWTLWLFDTDRAKSRSSGEPRSPTKGPSAPSSGRNRCHGGAAD